jgi:hypothetical protein
MAVRDNVDRWAPAIAPSGGQLDSKDFKRISLHFKLVQTRFDSNMTFLSSIFF